MLELQPEFLFKKGRLSQRISKVAVRKYSLKELFWSISQIFRKPSVVGCFCLVTIKNLYTPMDGFLGIFSNSSEQPFFRVTASLEWKKFQEQLSGYVFEIALLKYLGKLQRNYSHKVLKLKKYTTTDFLSK